MSDFVLRGLLKEIRCTQWFTLIADEASDISNKEQMCVVIRWVDDITGCDEYAVKAGGILRLMEKFSTYFGLKLCFLVFNST